ncbi:MAG: D-glycero-beta-D-manno-heptose-7-phosphate kinase [Verrucomicrobiia bacterium]
MSYLRRVKQILDRFPKQTILVIGDVMLDQFIWGKVSRISPEAPVPIVEVTRESSFPGGAANVARNLRALGANVRMLGVTGVDGHNHELRRLLQQQGINADGLLADASRPTTMKIRVVAHHQQIARIDRESTAPLSAEVAHQLLDHFAEDLTGVDAVIFEDYGKGVLSQQRLDAMQRLAHQRHKITAADPNARHPLKFSGLTAVTPNRMEAFAAARVPYAEPIDDVLHDKPLLRVGQILLKQWKPRNLLITLGEHGMCLFRKGEKPHHIQTVAQEVFDVSGAGDTAIATLALALTAGANAIEASEISNHAAGVVVGKIGTATCSTDELVDSFARNQR